ncbi:hypothetical protein [Fortiea contorta]|nr:hypothetical protein [Fortiea contorta]
MSNNTLTQTNHLIPKATRYLDNQALSNFVVILGWAKIQQQIFICAD